MSVVPAKSAGLHEVGHGTDPTMSTNKPGRLRQPPAPYSWLWLLVSGVIVWADMVTKEWASEVLTLYRPTEIWPWLNMTLAHNYGAAFSFLSDAGGWQRWFFTALASVVSAVLIIWVLRLPRREWLTGLALALVIGGALGNLSDRVQLGYVVDFIDVHYGGYHWPAFNVADSAITCGVVLLVFDALRQAWRGRLVK
jgi:signal peptidase II